MTTNTNKTPAEILALNSLLSNYPQELTFSEVLEKIEDLESSVVAWYPFEYFDPQDLTAEIERLARNIAEITPKRTEAQAEIIRDLLEGKKAEILNYDMGEEWAQPTLDAIENELNNLSN